MQEIIEAQIVQQKMEIDLVKTENGFVKRLYFSHVVNTSVVPNETVYYFVQEKLSHFQMRMHNLACVILIFDASHQHNNAACLCEAVETFIISIATINEMGVRI